MKYNNKKTIVDGIAFDSKREAARYEALKEMEKEGLIIIVGRGSDKKYLKKD